MTDPGGTIELFFRPGCGHVRHDGIYLPDEFAGGSSFTPEDNFRVYVTHELFHFAAQVSPGLNPAPTAFLNEGLAQSQAEGRVLKSWFGFDYHELAGAALRRQLGDGVDSYLDSATFLDRRLREPRVMATNASLCGWIIEQFGMPRYLDAFRRSKGCVDASGRSPTGHKDIESTRSAISDALGCAFAAVVDGWQKDVMSRRSDTAEKRVAGWA
jgi:hypothetical protein